MLSEPPIVPDMTAPRAFESAQPDALAFLDQPVDTIDRLLQEPVPLGTYGSTGLDTLPLLHNAPAGACAPPVSNFKDSGMYGSYSSPALQPDFMGHMAPPPTAQPAAPLDHSRSWSQDNYNSLSLHSSWSHDTYTNLRSSSYDAVYRQQPAPEVDAATELDRHSSGARSGSSGQDSLQGALGGVKQEDDDSDWEQVPKTRGSMGRTRQHNRSAQRRYREKQKARLAESDHKVAELTEQIKTLNMQKESLALRNALLEKLVSMRAAQAASGAASVVQAAPAAWWLDAQTRLLLEEMLGLGPQVTISVRPGPPVVLTRQQVVDLDFEEFKRTWQLYINAFAEALIAQGADNIETPAGQRVEQLLSEAFRFQCTMVLARPECAQGMHMHTELSGVHSRQLGAAEALRLLNLRPQQRKVLLHLRKLYVGNLAGMVARREELMAALQAVINAEADNRLMGIVKADDLRNVLRDEHSLWCQFQLCVWRQVLSPFQAASLMLQSHPAKADTMAVLEVLAAESGEPSYGQLMAEAAANPSKEVPPLDSALAMVPHCLAKG